MARKRQAPEPKPPTKNKKMKSIEDKEPDAMTSNSEQPRVTFMDLPVEIRTEIYEYVFAEDKPIPLRMHHKNNIAPREVWRDGRGRRPGKVYNKSTKKWDPAPLKHISILFASRQVFTEAEPILYGCNVFLLQTTTGLTEFIDRIGSRAQHIRHIQFTGAAYKKSTARSAFRALAVAKGLRTLVFAHEDVCGPGYSLASPYMIAQDCKMLMQALQKYRKENDISGRVPDVLKLEVYHNYHLCDVPKDEYQEQNEKLQAEARGYISEYLGLKD